MDKTQCEEFRRQIKVVADAVLGMRQRADTGLPGEAFANVILAYRHLEDASMRLGKAMQALDGGTSVYDRTQVPISDPGADPSPS